MPSKSYLVKRGDRYYYRRRVPSDVADQLGLREIKESLREGDRKRASAAAARRDHYWEQRFADIRKLRPVPIPRKVPPLVRAWITEEESRYLLGAVLSEALEQDDGLRIDHGRDNFTMGHVATSYRDQYDDLSAALRLGNVRIVEKELLAKLVRLGVDMDTTTDTYKRFAYSYLRQKVQALELIAQRAHGRPVDTPEPPALPSSAAPELRRKTGTALADVIERWEKERKPTARTVLDAKAIVRDFDKVNRGTRPLAALTVAHVVAYKDSLVDAGKKSATVRKRLALLKALLQYARRNGLVPFNVAQDVAVQGANDEEDRDPFSAEQLRQLFASPVFSSGKRWKAGQGEAAYWMPILALWTGARMGELGQLMVADVKHEGAVHFLEITDRGAGQSLKTKSSRRRVPLHPEVVRFGFLEYVATLEKGGQLFPGVRRSKTGQAAKTWGQWFGRYLRSVAGIADPRVDFHSFRHTFKDACRNSGIPKDVHDALTGHAAGDVGSGYGKGYSVEALAEWIGKLGYAASKSDGSTQEEQQ